MTMAVVIALVVFVGFAPTFYLRAFYHTDPLQSVFRVHGLVFSAWVVLFVVQTALVSARRTDIHRRLGVLGAALALLMLVMGYMAAVTAARRGFSTPGLPPPLVFFAVPFFDLVVFATLVGCALYLRRTPAAHKRLMLLATVAVLTAAIARLPYVLPLGPPAFFGLTDLLVVCRDGVRPVDAGPGAPGAAVGRPVPDRVAAPAPVHRRYRRLARICHVADGLTRAGCAARRQFRHGALPSERPEPVHTS